MAETSLLDSKTGDLRYIKELGYAGTIRHNEPSDLEEHLMDMYKRLPTYAKPGDKIHNRTALNED